MPTLAAGKVDYGEGLEEPAGSYGAAFARVDCLVMHCGLALVRDRIGEGQAVRALAIKGGPRLGTNSPLNKSTPVSFTASSAISHHVQISAILRRCSPSLPIDQVSNKQRS